MLFRSKCDMTHRAIGQRPNTEYPTHKDVRKMEHEARTNARIAQALNFLAVRPIIFSLQRRKKVLETCWRLHTEGFELQTSKDVDRTHSHWATSTLVLYFLLFIMLIFLFFCFCFFFLFPFFIFLFSVLFFRFLFYYFF